MHITRAMHDLSGVFDIPSADNKRLKTGGQVAVTEPFHEPQSFGHHASCTVDAPISYTVLSFSPRRVPRHLLMLKSSAATKGGFEMRFRSGCFFTSASCEEPMFQNRDVGERRGAYIVKLMSLQRTRCSVSIPIRIAALPGLLPPCSPRASPVDVLSAYWPPLRDSCPQLPTPSALPLQALSASP